MSNLNPLGGNSGATPYPSPEFETGKETVNAAGVKSIKINSITAGPTLEKYDYPKPIPKLVWQAFHYKSMVDDYQAQTVRTPHSEKALKESREAYANAQRLVRVICEKKGLPLLILD